MTQRQKDAEKSITADTDPHYHAIAYLHGYVDELAEFDVVPNATFKYLRRGSPQETGAREALVQVLRSHAKDIDDDFIRALCEKRELPPQWHLSPILKALADLFDEQEKGSRRLPNRKLMIQARSSGRQSHYEHDLAVVAFVCREMIAGRNKKRNNKESAVKAAANRFKVSRDTVFRVLNKFQEEVEARLR